MKRKISILALAGLSLLTTACFDDMFGPVEPVGPSVTTGEITNAAQTSLKISGTISNPDYKNKREEKKSGQVVEYGFVYGTSDNPREGSIFKAGDTISTFPHPFEKTITGLRASTAYKVWAYAKTEAGIMTYGNEAGQQTEGYKLVTHTTGTSNIAGVLSTVDIPELNNNPNAIVILTRKWPIGSGSDINPNPVCISYNAGDKWSIFNQNRAAMPYPVTYNLLIAEPSNLAFRHITKSTNILGNTTSLDHPTLNGNPGARFLVTQCRNTKFATTTPPYNPCQIAVFYDGTISKWCIFNQDGSAMKANCQFNILIDDGIFIAESKTENIFNNAFYIDPPRTSPNSFLFVTQYFTATSRFENQAVGVGYSADQNRWQIFNEDRYVRMHVNSKFLVLVK